MTIRIYLEKEVYYAGETLIGKVELNKKESVKINNNVTIRLHGFGEIFGYENFLNFNLIEGRYLFDF